MSYKSDGIKLQSVIGMGLVIRWCGTDRSPVSVKYTNGYKTITQEQAKKSRIEHKQKKKRNKKRKRRKTKSQTGRS